MKNRTPILLPAGELAADEIVRRFSDSALAIDATLRQFVLEKIRACPRVCPDATS